MMIIHLTQGSTRKWNEKCGMKNDRAAKDKPRGRASEDKDAFVPSVVFAGINGVRRWRRLGESDAVSGGDLRFIRPLVRRRG